MTKIFRCGRVKAIHGIHSTKRELHDMSVANKYTDLLDSECIDETDQICCHDCQLERRNYENDEI